MRLWRIRQGRRRGIAARISPLAAAAFLLLPARPAIAQLAVNPGAIEQETQRQEQRIQRQTATPKQQGPAVVGPAPAPKIEFPPGGSTLILKSVEFDKSEFLTTAELDAIAQRYIGTKVDLAAIQRLVQEVNDLYTQKGLVTANASLPPQKLIGGKLHVRLVEGRVGKATVTGAVQTSPRYIESAVPLEPGHVLDVRRLNKEVVWFNRTNDVQVRALLQPGADFGLTDVELAVTEPARDTLQFFTDNQGVKSTGRYELGTFFKHNGIFGIDDRFTLYGTLANGDLAGNVSYNVPVEWLGGRLGVSYGRSQIRTVEGPLRGLDDTGWSQTASINYSQPIFIDNNWTVLATGAASYATSNSDQAKTIIVNSHTNKLTTGLALTYSADNYSFSVSPNVSRAFAFNFVSDKTFDFSLFSGTTSNQLRLPADFSISFVGAWQVASRKLLPGDQLFEIGGPTTVRGFPTNAVSGDSGYYGQLELHRSLAFLTKGLDSYVFADHGAVYSTFPGKKVATAAGGGLSWTPFDWVTAEASVGFPLDKVVSNQPNHEMYYRLTIRPSF
jgi:hemolysin activation/secretion protein